MKRYSVFCKQERQFCEKQDAVKDETKDETVYRERILYNLRQESEVCVVQESADGKTENLE